MRCSNCTRAMTGENTHSFDPWLCVSCHLWPGIGCADRNDVAQERAERAVDDAAWREMVEKGEPNPQTELEMKK